MNQLKSRWIAASVSLAILVAAVTGHAEDEKKKEQGGRKPAAKQQPQQPPRSSTTATGQGTGSKNGTQSPRNEGAAKQEQHGSEPAHHETSSPRSEGSRGGSSAGEKRVEEQHADGKHVQNISAGGRKMSEEVHRPNGEVHTSHFDARGRVEKVEIVRPGGIREVSNNHFGRDGKVRIEERVTFHGGIATERIVIRGGIEHHFERGRFGFVYGPHLFYAAHPHLFLSWYNPYWYSPLGVVIVHPFHYSWGWEGLGWYHSYHHAYWNTYAVYPAPSYWVTDWMVAGYLSDHYEAQISVDQAREEARLAHEEADKARLAAGQAQLEAEIAEAKTAAANAEFRAKAAEEKVARVERQEAQAKQYAGQPNPNATPIDDRTKEALKNQIEKTIAEKKEFADKGGSAPPPDLSKALTDPEHIYPVSKLASVTLAASGAPAGTLTEGDLLRVEPGQEKVLANPGPATLVKMRVMTSKGEDGEVAAGTVVNVGIGALQDFDSEFQSKLDAGLAEAETKQDSFKQGAVAAK